MANQSGADSPFLIRRAYKITTDHFSCEIATMHADVDHEFDRLSRRRNHLG